MEPSVASWGVGVTPSVVRAGVAAEKPREMDHVVLARKLGGPNAVVATAVKRRVQQACRRAIERPKQGNQFQSTPSGGFCLFVYVSLDACSVGYLVGKKLWEIQLQLLQKLVIKYQNIATTNIDSFFVSSVG